jgi:hypothetical protein
MPPGNWVYVALSCVKSLEGLFLQKKLDRTQSLRPNERIQQMLQQTRTKQPTPYNLQSFQKLNPLVV